MINDKVKAKEVPYLTMGELCLEANNKNLAIMAFRKEKGKDRYTQKVQWLIKAEAWQEAVDEIFTVKAHEDFDMLLDEVRNGCSFAEDLIKDRAAKKK